MAQTILCDMTDNHVDADGPPPANVMLGDMDTGDQTALCTSCFTLMAIALARQVESMEAGEQPPAGDDGDDEDDEDAEDAAVDRLETVNGNGHDAAAGPAVVKRGTSRSRKAYEARKREKAAAATEAETAD